MPQSTPTRCIAHEPLEEEEASSQGEVYIRVSPLLFETNSYSLHSINNQQSIIITPDLFANRQSNPTILMASQQEQTQRLERSSSIVSSASSTSANWLELTTPSTSSAASHTFLELTAAAATPAPTARKNSLSRVNTNSEERQRLMLLRARFG